MITIHTGGADGADLYFEKKSLEFGYNVKAYSFEGHKTKSRKCVILSPERLSRANSIVLAASRQLNKEYPTKDFILNLIRRNFYQVATSQVVIAISSLDRSKTYVNGGTGWAVEMAKMLNLNIAVYDQIKNQWYYWIYKTRWFDMLDHVPSLGQYSNITGIGTRQLNENGRKAIDNIFTSLRPIRPVYLNRNEKD